MSVVQSARVLLLCTLLTMALIAGCTTTSTSIGTTPGGAEPSATQGACGPDPFAHVYHPARLKVLAACRTITGTIDFVRREPDGDDHIRLRVDDVSLLDQGNIDNQHGDLVLEPVCINPVTQEDAKDACAGYHSDVVVPPAGTRVSVTGPWVLDTEHGWNEIHPVVRISVNP